MEQEIWKEIANSKFYAVSNFGRIKRLEHSQWNNNNQSYSIYTEKILHINYTNSKKYGRVAVTFNDDTRRIFGIHRLVAQCFIENFNDLPQINHKDGNKTNNHVSNLEWCSASDNMQHRIHTLDIRPWKKGELCNFNKLTENQVKQIPILLQQGMNKREIARILNTCFSNITEITSGRSWKHLNLF